MVGAGTGVAAGFGGVAGVFLAATGAFFSFGASVLAAGAAEGAGCACANAPCVGFAASPEEAQAFAAAGADFVLVGDFVWADPRGAQAALVEAGQAIRQAYDAAFGKARAG